MSDSKASKNIGIHFFYVALILSLTIVVLITKNWTKLSGFTEYLNVAATVSSLVLGILAIIYSFVSSGAMSSFLGSIERANKDMGQVTTALGDVVNKGQKIQEQAEARTVQLHSLATNLSLSINELTKTTHNIKQSVDALPQRIDSIKERLPFSKENSSEGTRGRNQWTNAELDSFLKISSGIGLLAMRLAIEAGAKKVYASMAGFYDSEFEYYGHGFLMASDAANVMDVSTKDSGSVIPHVYAIATNAQFYDLLMAEWETRKEKNEDGEGVLLESNEEKITKAVNAGTPIGS